MTGSLPLTGVIVRSSANVQAGAKTRLSAILHGAWLVALVVTNLLTGVLIGVGLSIAHLVYTLTHLKIDLSLSEDKKRADLRLEGSATFLAMPRIGATLERVPRGAELHVHLERLQHIDHACLDALHDWQKQHEKFGSSLVVEWQDLVARYGGSSPVPPEPARSPKQRIGLRPGSG